MKIISGPDISFYQNDPETPPGIDFIKMRSEANFVIIRAGQNVWPDPTFKKNWSNAKAAGLPRGSYWFYDSRVEPKQQADLWVEQFAGDFGELPLFADLEENYQGPYQGWRKWREFLERVRLLVGNKEIAIYTGFFYWQDNAPDPVSDPANLEYFHKYPLWIANYGVQKPSIPKPWLESEWLFWQFTDKGDGQQYGVESLSIDLNFFNGDGDVYTHRFNLSVPEVPHEYPPIMVSLGKYKVTTSTLNVRQGPGTGYKSLGYIRRDEIVDVYGANPDKSWFQIQRADGLKGWSSGSYLIFVSPPSPPPPGTTNQSKVSTTTLYVREGPATTYKALGYLVRDEIVDVLGSNADGSWLQVRRTKDGLTGWSSGRYLVPLVSPPPPPAAGDQYKVTAASLNVREGPGTSFKSLGYLKLNEVIYSLGANTDGTWLRIQRADGLVGWSSKRYLVLVSNQ